jgi:hypothetical protein
VFSFEKQYHTHPILIRYEGTKKYTNKKDTRMNTNEAAYENLVQTITAAAS